MMCKSQYSLSALIFCLFNALSVSAGQISVINPSSGSEASGVVIFIPSPQVTVSTGVQSSTPQVSSNFNGIDQTQSTNLESVEISNFLDDIDVQSFTSAQKAELELLLRQLLEYSGLSASKRQIFESQLSRF